MRLKFWMRLRNICAGFEKEMLKSELKALFLSHATSSKLNF